MRNLHIVDVSATLHGGIYSFADNNSHGFPTGGVFNTLKCFSGKGFDPTQDQVLFCFDRKTRQTTEDGELTGYKEGRKKWTSSMYHQAKLLEHMLEKSGFYTFHEEDRESDEGIIAYAKEFIPYFEHTYIYGTDRDLASVVGPKCTLVSTHSKVSNVTYENFTYTVALGEYVPYNAIMLYKVFRKDSSDNIKGIMNPTEFAQLIDSLGKANFPIHLLNTEEALQFVIERFNGDEETKAILWDNYSKVVPREIEVIHDLTIPAPIDKEMLDRFCSALSLSMFAKKFGVNLTGEVDNEWYDQIKELATEIKTEAEEINEGKTFKYPKPFVPKYFKLVDKPCKIAFLERR